MASGEYKNIENIKVGEYVMALNEKQVNIFQEKF